MKPRLASLLLATLPLGACTLAPTQPPKAVEPPPAEQAALSTPLAERELRDLKGFAFCRCLVHGGADPALAGDADQAAGGYLERGRLGMAAYRRLDELAADYAARPYPGKQGGQLNLIRCLDLYDDPQLEREIRELAK